jgi:hypothetical protein
VNTEWKTAAPCSGLPGFTPEHKKDWHTRKDLILVSLVPLKVCGPCPYQALCIQEVKPRQAKFDGVCGGRIWHQGEILGRAPGVDRRDLWEPPLRASCGTEAGEKDHRRNGEDVCRACREATKLLNARRSRERERGKKRAERQRHLAVVPGTPGGEDGDRVAAEAA